MSREEEILDALYDHTLDGEAEPVVELTKEALALGMAPLTILFDGLIPALEEVGRLFEEGEYFVPEMLVAARAMAGAMEILKPLIAESGAKPVGKFVMGTVKGDIHDIGKNLCNIMLEGAGFEVYDIGVNAPPDKFVEAVREHQPDAVGICRSAILSRNEVVVYYWPAFIHASRRTPKPVCSSCFSMRLQPWSTGSVSTLKCELHTRSDGATLI